MTSISISNIGPVTEFEYDLKGPGLHVLRGRQGVGKTTILRTVQLATDGRTDTRPTKRDGTRRGEARVAGKTIKIAKQIREEGEIGVEGLGDLNISELHSPKYQDPVTRDKHRIKTLVRLCGVQADASLFHELLGDDQAFDAIVPADSLSTSDLVEMAARVKRAIEREALGIESQEQTARANARAQEALADGIDTDVEDDESLLQKHLEGAIDTLSQLKRQRSSAEAVISRAHEARAKLGEVARDGKALDELHAELDGAEELVRASEKTVEKLREELAQAERQLESNVAKAEAVSKLCDEAKRNADLTAGWRADIEAAESVERPTDEELQSAHSVVESAKAALAGGADARLAKAAREQAREHLDHAEQLATRALRLRDAARDTAEVLTSAIASIPGCPLKIRLSDAGDPRLVLHTDRSEHESFDDLSDGERWPVIMRLAAERNRLIVLSQAAYGELSPKTREQIDALAKAQGCYVLTAVADDGELRGTAFDPQDNDQ